MAIVYWKGGAAAVAKVVNCTVASTGAIEATDIFRCTIGNKVLSVVGGSTAAGTVATNIKTAWNALSATTHPEFAEITAASTGGASLTLTADTAGVDFTVTLTTVETNGNPSDAQTFTQTTTVANAGPNDWSTAANWSGGAVPVNTNEVVFENSTDGIYYGLDQSAVTLASLTIKQDFLGTIGLPTTNESGYSEYRDTYLKIGATVCTIGSGEGSGSGRIKINTGSVQTALTLLDSGYSLEDGLKSVIWKGTHASNAVAITKGSLDIAPFAAEVATVLTLKEGYFENIDDDSDVRCGSGVTLGTVTKNGGQLTCDNTAAAITALTQTAGDTTIYGITNAVTALTIYGGAVHYNTAGTLTACTVGAGATLDFRQDMRAKTVSAITAYPGAAIYDPAAVVTWTTGIDLVGGGLEDYTLQIGKHRTWTPTAI